MSAIDTSENILPPLDPTDTNLVIEIAEAMITNSPGTVPNPYLGDNRERGLAG